VIRSQVYGIQKRIAKFQETVLKVYF